MWREDEMAWAITILLEEAHQLPDSLVAELREYSGKPDARPTKLARKQSACLILLDFAEDLPSPLAEELTEYAEQLWGRAQERELKRRPGEVVYPSRPGAGDRVVRLRLRFRICPHRRARRLGERRDP